MSVLNFFQCYLFAWAFWTSLTVGCVGLLCLHHAVKASWALPILRVLESGAKLIPYHGVGCFLPILFQVWTRTGGDFYPWTNTAAVRQRRGSETPSRGYWLESVLVHGSEPIIYFRRLDSFSPTTLTEFRTQTGQNRRSASRRTAGEHGRVGHLHHHDYRDASPGRTG